MITRLVKSPEMLTVLCIKDLEDKSREPHSCQSNLHLIIPFEEFAKLCLTLKEYGDNVLSVSSTRLSKLAQSYTISQKIERELRSIYMKEVAYAMLREVHYSQKFGKGLTRISHTWRGQGVLEFTDIQAIANDELNTVNILNYMRQCEYPVGTNFTSASYEMYCYAIALFNVAGNEIGYHYKILN